ncbi:MAG: class I SAM-dependent methyltransferase [Proteobacteria bacterium]|nr:class I SAM-dependent methyltransferase [Pseudomonadota bacterium]MBI3499541.1 class I SAM-dependent methyltransferase [Pseudomonadota bacterium]
MTRDNDPVRAQYETYPYPPRDPRDESKRLIEGSPSHLLEIDHYIYAGKRDWRLPFRALIAGGGTGDGAIMLAQHLADRAVPAAVNYIDLSSASLAVAKARAKARGLANISFEQRAIEAVDEEAAFDYIDCCGVLHHLAYPKAGLARLARALKPEGGIGLMVYATFGRTGVYPMQALIRQIADDLPDRERISLTRRLLAQLPPTNWLQRNPFVGDHVTGDDAGVYDLLLHRQDRSYSVPELAELLAGAGLRVSSFIEPARYEPRSYVSDATLLPRFDRLAPLDRAAAAERLAGNLARHVLYAVRADNAGPSVASPDSPDWVPVFRNLDPATVAAGIKPSGTLTAEVDGVILRSPLPPLAPAIAKRIDGRSSLGEIRQALTGEVAKDLDEAAFDRQFRLFYAAFNGLNRLLLRQR